MITPLLLAFVVAAFLLTITPGLDTALVLRTSAIDGALPAACAAMGISIGCLGWGAAASLGLGAVLQASEVAYAILKWIGAAYLVWMGVTMLLRPRDALVVETAAPQRSWPAAMRRGFLTNILNPKVGVFYVTFIPQFIPAGATVAGYSFFLAAVHSLVSLLWLLVLVAATAPLGRLLRRPAIVRGLDRLTGGVFVLFGARLALARD